MKEMIQEIGQAYERIQCLDIQPTRNNVAILQYVMDVLSGSYRKLTEMEAAKEPVEAQEGRDAHGTD